MLRKFTVQEEHVIRVARQHWCALEDEQARNRFANGHVMASLTKDWTSLGIVRALVYEVASKMKLPQGPLTHDMEEYRAEVAVRAIERLEANQLRNWAKYVERMCIHGHGRFQTFVRVVCFRGAVSLCSKRRATHVELPEEQMSVPHAGKEAVELVRLLEFTSTLSERKRKALLLRAAGYSWREVAKMAGFKNAADATAQIHLVRAKLRAWLGRPKPVRKKPN